MSKSELRANVHCPKLSQGGMIGVRITTTSTPFHIPFHADTANDNDNAFELIFNHVF